MARLDTTGLDEVIQDMERMGQMSGAIAEQMVDAAAQVIRDSWKRKARNSQSPAVVPMATW